MKKFSLAFILLALVMVSSCKHKRDYNGDLISENPCNPNTVYFQNTILPMLNSNCGFSGCHNAGTHAEGINVTNYQTIMNSGEGGDFVVYGYPKQSSLYEVVSSGSMPPSPYPALSNSQVQAIYSWIDQGAFNNYCAQCDTNSYTFSGSVWPLINNNCTGCHQGATPNGGILLTNYTDVYTQVQNYEIPGVLNDPTNYPVMPPSGPLSSCQIQVIQKWINDGAPNN